MTESFERLLDRMSDLEWPTCVQCGSDETTVVPASGEWTCGACGCRWTSDETPVSTGDDGEISRSIVDAVEHLVQMAESDTPPDEFDDEDEEVLDDG